MCGIVRTLTKKPGQSVTSPDLRAVVHIIDNRGPDESGAYIDEPEIRPGRERLFLELFS